jgi:hypothetical protein
MSYVGEYHIRFRAKGTDRNLTIFHTMMQKIDHDWPWGPSHSNGRVCLKCCGATWNGPRIGVEDVKIAARQAGVKVKIHHFGSQTKCRGSNLSYNWQLDQQRVTIEELHDLIAAHGVVKFQEKYIQRPRIVTPPGFVRSPLPTIPSGIIVIPPSHQVCPSEGSLVQHPSADGGTGGGITLVGDDDDLGGNEWTM